MARLIELTQGQWALVDDEDFEWLSKFKWYALKKHGGNYYATRGVYIASKRSRRIWMAREILGLEEGDGLYADHINHDTLDNRRGNLRIVSALGNQENRKDQAPYGPGIWKFEGLPYRPYAARAYKNGRQYYLGSFATAEEAREARSKFLELHGSELGSM